MTPRGDTPASVTYADVQDAARVLVTAQLSPLVEELATEKLLQTGVKPRWLVYGALALTLGAAFAFTAITHRYDDAVRRAEGAFVVADFVQFHVPDPFGC